MDFVMRLEIIQLKLFDVRKPDALELLLVIKDLLGLRLH